MPDYGLDIAIPFIGDPDPTLPWADDDDALLVPGSILLFDPAHSANPMIGVPAVGADIPNIAWKRFKDMCGGAVFTGRIDNGNPGNAGTVLTVSAVASGVIVPGQTVNAAGMSVNAYWIGPQVSGMPGGVGVYSVGYTAGLNIASTAMTTLPIDAATAALYRDGFADNPAISVTERSGKGGLHNIQTQTNGAVNSGMAIRARVALEGWVNGNPGHSYYFSAWDRSTRQATGNEPGEHFVGLTTSSYLLSLAAAGTTPDPSSWLPPASSGRRLGVNAEPANLQTLGNRFRSMGVAPSPMSNFRLYASLHGNAGPYASLATLLNRSASRILYRIYMEDLTVSGRTYAQVQALDYALYQAAFAAGGRYAGDTFTAPAI